MAGVHELSCESRSALRRAQNIDYGKIAAAMDAISAEVVSGGGSCNEETLIAAFFGSAAYHDDAHGANLDNHLVPHNVVDNIKKTRKLQLCLGEPFAYASDGLLDQDLIGVIARNPGNGDDSPVLAYRIFDYGGSYEGRIVFNAFSVRRNSFGHLPEDPTAGRHIVSVFRRLKSAYPQNALVVPSRLDGGLIVGMPDIRQAAIDNPRYIAEGVWRNMDESVDLIRRFAGEALLCREVSGAGAD